MRRRCRGPRINHAQPKKTKTYNGKKKPLIDYHLVWLSPKTVPQGGGGGAH